MEEVFKHFTIPVPMFNAVVHVVYADDGKDWPKATSLLTNPYGVLRDEVVKYVEYCAEGELPNAACTYFGKTIIILLNKEHFRESTLVHECVHAAQFLEEASQIKDSSGEFQAYVSAYVFREVKRGLAERGLIMIKE